MSFKHTYAVGFSIWLVGLSVLSLAVTLNTAVAGEKTYCVVLDKNYKNSGATKKDNSAKVTLDALYKIKKSIKDYGVWYYHTGWEWLFIDEFRLTKNNHSKCVKFDKSEEEITEKTKEVKYSYKYDNRIRVSVSHGKNCESANEKNFYIKRRKQFRLDTVWQCHKGKLH